MHKQQNAFTLVEMMVTIAVLAIVLGVATPSFLEMLRQNTLRSQANELLGLMHYARTEAIKRRENVAVTLTPGSGWKAEVTQPGSTTLLRSLDKTATSVSLSGATVTDIVFDLRGRRQSDDNCFQLSYYTNYRRLLIEAGGSIKIEPGQCGG